MPSLIWLFLIPILASIIALLSGFFTKSFQKYSAICMSLIPLLMLLYGRLDWIGTEIKYEWLPNVVVEFYLAIDSTSLLFLFLVSVVVPITLFSVPAHSLSYSNVFFGLVLLLQGLLNGFFTARDLALFTFFWEAMLIPLYFIIILWGDSEKRRVALKFIVYMIAGGALMIAAVLSLYINSSILEGEGTFNLNELVNAAQRTPYASWVFGVFMLAFAVKTPLFPFHAWLPDVYYSSSTAGTILLSALLSKAGIYGIIRIGMGLFPTLLQEWSPFLLGLALTGVLYGGLAAWSQKDYKRLIAYSSFSHVNVILAGLFVWNDVAHSGAILQSINHGLTITALFLLASWLAQRIETTQIGSFHGMAKYLPRLCWITLFFVLASIALPGTNNFVGELLILFGVFQVAPWIAFILALTLILSAVYMLRWMQNMYFETPIEIHKKMVDIRLKEILNIFPLAILILWIGIYPSPFLNQTKLTFKDHDQLALNETQADLNSSTILLRQPNEH
ncbi:MAG: NADH-quinone oxidoreductase subunit M [Parachlamydiaceae bacterium]|nr:NADH-quinone oxidoreductase subunit M [Parachlamydiaceae bacterium]